MADDEAVGPLVVLVRLVFGVAGVTMVDFQDDSSSFCTSIGSSLKTFGSTLAGIGLTVAAKNVPAGSGSAMLTSVSTHMDAVAWGSFAVLSSRNDVSNLSTPAGILFCCTVEVWSTCISFADCFGIVSNCEAPRDAARFWAVGVVGVISTFGVFGDIKSGDRGDIGFEGDVASGLLGALGEFSRSESLELSRKSATRSLLGDAASYGSVRAKQRRFAIKRPIRDFFGDGSISDSENSASSDAYESSVSMSIAEHGDCGRIRWNARVARAGMIGGDDSWSSRQS